MQLSIVIPVYNEQSLLLPRLQALQALRSDSVEIIVVDGQSTDGSAQLLSEFKGQLVDQYAQCPPGRAWQMNLGASLARGEWIWFLHLDSRLLGFERNSWPLPHEYLSNERSEQLPLCGWGYYQLQLCQRSWPFRLIAWGINFRSRLRGGATGDQGIFLRRDVFESIGGYAELPLMEDIELTDRLRARSKGWLIPAKIETASRRWQKRGIIKTILFMWKLRLRYRLGADPWQLAKLYYPDVSYRQPSQTNDSAL